MLVIQSKKKTNCSNASWTNALSVPYSEKLENTYTVQYEKSVSLSGTISTWYFQHHEIIYICVCFFFVGYLFVAFVNVVYVNFYCTF